MRQIAAKLFFCLFVLASIPADCSNAEELRIGGSGSALSTVFVPVKPHFLKETGISLVILYSTAKDGVFDLINGKIDAATAAASLEWIAESAAKEGEKIYTVDLRSAVIGTLKTTVIAHRDNKVDKLSKEQLKGIFTGKINNWKEVGGDDRDIIVVWGRNTPEQNAQFVKEALDGEPVTQEVLEAPFYSNISEAVATTREAIGINPVGLLEPSLKSIATGLELSSPVVLITAGDAVGKEKKLIDYVGGEGKKYVK